MANIQTRRYENTKWRIQEYSMDKRNSLLKCWTKFSGDWVSLQSSGKSGEMRSEHEDIIVDNLKISSSPGCQTNIVLKWDIYFIVKQIHIIVQWKTYFIVEHYINLPTRWQLSKIFFKLLISWVPLYWSSTDIHCGSKGRCKQTFILGLSPK